MRMRMRFICFISWGLDLLLFGYMVISWLKCQHFFQIFLGKSCMMPLLLIKIVMQVTLSWKWLLCWNYWIQCETTVKFLFWIHILDNGMQLCKRSNARGAGAGAGEEQELQPLQIGSQVYRLALCINLLTIRNWSEQRWSYCTWCEHPDQKGLINPLIKFELC